MSSPCLLMHRLSLAIAKEVDQLIMVGGDCSFTDDFLRDRVRPSIGMLHTKHQPSPVDDLRDGLALGRYHLS